MLWVFRESSKEHRDRAGTVHGAPNEQWRRRKLSDRMILNQWRRSPVSEPRNKTTPVILSERGPRRFLQPGGVESKDLHLRTADIGQTLKTAHLFLAA